MIEYYENLSLLFMVFHGVGWLSVGLLSCILFLMVKKRREMASVIALVNDTGAWECIADEPIEEYTYRVGLLTHMDLMVVSSLAGPATPLILLLYLAGCGVEKIILGCLS